MAPGVDEIPTNVRKWKALAKSHRTLGTINTLGSQEKIKSASKFEFNHFLGLRMIYEKPRTPSKLPNSIVKQFDVDPDLSLDNLGGWNAYLEEIQNSLSRNDTKQTISQTCVPTNLRGLANVWQFQRHILQMDTKSVEESKVSEVTPVAPGPNVRATRRRLFQSPTPASKSHPVSLSRQTIKMQKLNIDTSYASDADAAVENITYDGSNPEDDWEEGSETGQHVFKLHSALSFKAYVPSGYSSWVLI